jgi:hypothetical protein
LGGTDEYEAMVELLIWKTKETQKRTSLVPTHPPQIHINLLGIEPETLQWEASMSEVFCGLSTS